MTKAMNDPALEPDQIIETFSKLSIKLRHARSALADVVFGQDEIIEQSLIAIVSGGHGLLVGAPGLAKTLLVSTVSTVLGLQDKRVQFTPDLMPADVIGSEVLDEDDHGKRHFRFIQGPIFCQLLMADEINRASPRTQSSLLQAMQEGFVTVAGEKRALPYPFHVLATQNPIEQEGTYPLPEAQLDRFLLQINITYPPEEAERRMLSETTKLSSQKVSQSMSSDELVQAQKMVRAMPIGEDMIDRILNIVRQARPNTHNASTLSEKISWGPGPRASQALSLAVRARALIDGRESPSLDDIAALAKPVLRHRMALTFSARAEGLTTDHLIDELVNTSL